MENYMWARCVLFFPRFNSEFWDERHAFFFPFFENGGTQRAG